MHQSSLKEKLKQSRGKFFAAVLLILLLIIIIAVLSITLYNRKATYPAVPPNVDSAGTNGIHPDSLHH